MHNAHDRYPVGNSNSIVTSCQSEWLSGCVTSEAVLVLMLLIINVCPQGAMEWPSCYHIAGDNNPQAVKRAANNICSLLNRQESKER